MLRDGGRRGISQKVNDALQKLANEAQELARLKIITREQLHRCAEVCGGTEPSMGNDLIVGRVKRVMFPRLGVLGAQGSGGCGCAGSIAPPGRGGYRKRPSTASGRSAKRWAEMRIAHAYCQWEPYDSHTG